MPRPKKYHQDMKVTTLYLPENVYQNLKETAKLKGCSVNELVVEILSNNLSPIEVINKKIEELEKQLEELHDLRQRTIARMISSIPESHKNHIRGAVRHYLTSTRTIDLSRSLRSFSKNIPRSTICLTNPSENLAG